VLSIFLCTTSICFLFKQCYYSLFPVFISFCTCVLHLFVLIFVSFTYLLFSLHLLHSKSLSSVILFTLSVLFLPWSVIAVLHCFCQLVVQVFFFLLVIFLFVVISLFYKFTLPALPFIVCCNQYGSFQVIFLPILLVV
jgi:hypothetical protein